jgi:dolichol-phosphate mannosyltransferase
LKVAVVIPTFKVSGQIIEVVDSIGSDVHLIIVVDDQCPEQSGLLVSRNVKDPRVIVMTNVENLGVGGAVKVGYQRALAEGSDIIVKIDGDGQMDPKMINRLLRPILETNAGYTKGNRFFNVEDIRKMPKLRILGNLVLSFMSKLSTGYWRIFDPTNGFTAIRADVLSLLPLNKIDNRYFFESDILFRLNIARVPVVDVQIPAHYGTEKSNLNIPRTIIEFPRKHFRNFVKRIVYSYYLREFTLASIELPLGIVLILFAIISGTHNWLHSLSTSIPTETGTIVLIAMSFLSGLQLILGFFAFDIANAPSKDDFTLRSSKVGPQNEAF